MSCTLIGLSIELHLKIVENLLPDATDEDHIRHNNHELKYRNALFNWSRTARGFRDLLGPYLFRSVYLRNNDKSGSSLLQLSESRYSDVVKELHFVGSAPGDAHEDEEAYGDTEAILPNSVNKLLSNLYVFPKLEKLSIRFEYRFTDWDEWEEGLDICETEQDDDVSEAEQKIAWRTLMARTYEAVARNNSPKTVEILGLVRKNVSTLSSPAFHAFLAQVEHFTLSIYGEDNGAGWHINTHAYYVSMMSKLDRLFFDHLKRVRWDWKV